jgi:hypothetical protein
MARAMAVPALPTRETPGLCKYRTAHYPAPSPKDATGIEKPASIE